MKKKGLLLGSVIVDFFSIFLFAIFAVILFFIFSPTTVTPETIGVAIADNSERILLLNYLRTPTEEGLTFADMIGIHVKGTYETKLKTQTEEFLDTHAYGLSEEFGRANIQVAYFDTVQNTQKGPLVLAGEGCKKLTAGIAVPTTENSIIATVSLLRCEK